MRWLLALVLALPLPAAALDIRPPGATMTGEDASPADSVRLPEAMWTPGSTPPEREGAIRRRAYTVADPTRTTLQLLGPARDTLEAAGYSQVYACADAACGGFDFRFQLDLLPEPVMHVDLGDFRYLLMKNVEAAPRYVAVVASSSATAGFLHVTEVFPVAAPRPAPSTGADPVLETTPAEPPLPGLATSLVEFGHVVLDDLDFGTGSAELGPGPFESLDALAAWLRGTPSARVLLVGHTDAVGSQEANVQLSERRAAAVAERLVAAHGTAPEQLQSIGAGYLAPVASNLTDQGRAANRRVEVVLLSQ